MRLHTLRPTEGADLFQLRSLLDGRGWRAAVPDSLPDNVLLRLARDFRSIESSLTKDASDEEVAGLAPAMYVVMNLLLHHPARGGVAHELSVSDTSMIRAFQMYQWGLEREIVTRIVGFGSSNQTDSLLDGLWRSIQHE